MYNNISLNLEKPTMKLIQNTNVALDEDSFQPVVSYTGVISIEKLQEGAVSEEEFATIIGKEFLLQIKAALKGRFTFPE